MKSYAVALFSPNFFPLLATMLFMASPNFSAAQDDLSIMTASDRKVKVSCTVPAKVTERDPIPLKLKVANGGSSTLTVFEFQEWPKSNTKITVFDAKNQEVVRNMKGHISLGHGNLATYGHPLFVSKIEPGKEKAWSVNLAPLFPLPPGKYTVSIEFSALDQVTKDSCSVTIQKLPFSIAAGVR